MHGLVNRAIQCFVRDVYGARVWSQVVALTPGQITTFEAMLHYDDAVTDQLMAAACRVLCRPRDMMLEDLGTYLVAHPNREAIRRLMRFGGAGFEEFLFSLDDLPGRARLAVPDLDLAEMTVCQSGKGQFVLRCSGCHPGFGLVLLGLLRAMADDYGALALLEHRCERDRLETVTVHLLESRFAEGRSFALSQSQ